MSLLVAILFGISQVQGSVECIENFETYQNEYIEPILHKLKAKNYTIHNGTIFWVTNVTKHGGSPATTYGFWDINTSATFHNHQRLKPNPETPWSMLFHSSDAILWSGCTPPKASYMGITNYAFAKYRGHKTHGPNITEYGEDVTNRTESVVFSSMNSAVNQYFANTDTKSSKAYGDIWDSRMTVITTGDQVTYNDIYDEYMTAGLTDQVNNIWIPESLFQFIPYNFTKHDYDVWNYPGPIDSFCPCYRIIDPLDDPDYWRYTSYKQPVYWITAEKLRPDDAVKPRKVFTEIPTRNITAERDESELAEPLQAYINDTIAYMEKEHNMTFIEQLPYSDYYTDQGMQFYYGTQCYEFDVNCQADLRDETYLGTHNGSLTVQHVWIPNGVYHLFNDSYFLTVGVNHVNYNYTVYDNLILYVRNGMENSSWINAPIFEPMGILNMRDFNMSANNAGIPTSVDQETLSKLYIVQTARPQNCDGINIPQICPSEEHVGYFRKFAMMTRNLLNPQTLTRPARNQMLMDQFLIFRIGRDE